MSFPPETFLNSGVSLTFLTPVWPTNRRTSRHLEYLPVRLSDWPSSHRTVWVDRFKIAEEAPATSWVDPEFTFSFPRDFSGGYRYFYLCFFFIWFQIWCWSHHLILGLNFLFFFIYIFLSLSYYIFFFHSFLIIYLLLFYRLCDLWQIPKWSGNAVITI